MKKKSIVFSCFVSPPIMLIVLSYFHFLISIIFIVILIAIIIRIISRKFNKNPAQKLDQVVNKILPLVFVWIVITKILLFDYSFYVLGYVFLLILILIIGRIAVRTYQIKTSFNFKIIQVILFTLLFLTICMLAIPKYLNGVTTSIQEDKNQYELFDSPTFGSGCGSSSLW